MARYQFTSAERYAIFVTHGEKCYLCGEPVDLGTMQVDHIVPESLKDRPGDFEAAREQLGLSDDFSIDSFANWMPSHSDCNRKKSDMVFSPSLLVQVAIQTAAEKAGRAAALADKAVSRRGLTVALNTLERAHEAGDLPADIVAKLEPLIALTVESREKEMADEPIRFKQFFEVVGRQGGIEIVRGPYGVGGRPARSDVDPSFDCPNCGKGAAWNGARCVGCGMLIDD